MNTSAWSTCKELLQISDNQYISGTCLLLQETKLQDAEDIRAAQDFLSSLGYQSVFGPAHTTEQGGLSGGVAVAIKTGMDIGVQPLPIPVPQQLRHRVTGVIIDSPGLVKHVLLSVYAVPRLGLQGGNVRLLG